MSRFERHRDGSGSPVSLGPWQSERDRRAISSPSFDPLAVRSLSVLSLPSFSLSGRRAWVHTRSPTDARSLAELDLLRVAAQERFAHVNQPAFNLATPDPLSPDL